MAEGVCSRSDAYVVLVPKKICVWNLRACYRMLSAERVFRVWIQVY
jgi:hypothetical protein